MNNEGPHPRRGVFEQLRKTPIIRKESQWLGGVATGIADYFKVDVILIRGIIVVLSILGGLGLIVYGVAWAFLPDTQGRIHLERALNREWTSGMTGSVIFVALGIFPAPWFLDSLAPILWPIAIVAAILFIVFSRKNTRFARPGQPGPKGPKAPAPSRSSPKSNTTDVHGTALERPWRDDDPQVLRSSSSTASFTQPADDSTKEYTMSSNDPGPTGPYTNAYTPDPTYTKAYHPKPAKRPVNQPVPGWIATTVVGLTVLAIAVVLMADYLNFVQLPGAGWAVALACGLFIVGLAIVGAALGGRTSGSMLGLGIPLLVLTVIFSATSFETTARDVVRSATGSDSQYSAVFSNSTVDLTHLGTISNPTTVEIDSVFSRTNLLLPDTVPVQIKTDGAFLSGTELQLPQDVRSLPANAPTLTIEVDGVFSSYTSTVDDPNVLNHSNEEF